MIYIALGTNLGDRYANLARARNKLYADDRIIPVRESTIADTAPVDYTQQPRFLNQIVAVDTALSPPALLEFIQHIEAAMLKKIVIRRGPRIIDLDILLYHDKILQTDLLEIPHPRIMQRDFILKHLVELDSDLKDPVSKKLYSEVLRHGNNKKHQ